MKQALPVVFLLVLSAAAFAQGDEQQLKGELKAITADQVTVITADKASVAVVLDRATRFEKDGKPSKASEFSAGNRVVVLLRVGGKGRIASTVNLVAVALAAQRVEVSVTPDGFVFTQAKAVKAGQAVTLVVTRKVELTCAKDVVIKEFGISKALPLNQPVEVTFVPKNAGKVHIACAMNMISSDLLVE